MGRRTAAARINLSVTPDLKNRMNAVARSNGVNWSAVVHPLFEAEVVMLERGHSDQSAVVRRLLALKLEAERQQLISGRIDGRDWVENDVVDYEALERLNRNASRYRNSWDRPWEQLRCAVDPTGQFTEEEVSAHFFGEDEDDCWRDRPYYLSAFLEGALQTFDELRPKVEVLRSSMGFLPPGQSEANNDDITAAPAAPAETTELPASSAHCVTQTADAPARRRDAVTLALAEPVEAPEPTPSRENPPPRTRPVLKIVSGVIDAIVPTSMREWLFKEHPMDYNSSPPSPTPSGPRD
jgi:hypothetical protein